MKKDINVKKLVVILFIFCLILSGCRQLDKSVDGKDVISQESVNIVDKDNYFEVSLDFDSKSSHEEVGKEYANAILEVAPNYEELVDSYLKEICLNDDTYKSAIKERVPNVKQFVDEKYLDEIEGMAKVFSNDIDEDIIGDGKLSSNEVYLFNLIPDVIRGSQCSVISVYGSKSETGNNIIVC